MKVFIARNSDNSLWLFRDKPILNTKVEGDYWWMADNRTKYGVIHLRPENYPEVNSERMIEVEMDVISLDLIV